MEGEATEGFELGELFALAGSWRVRPRTHGRLAGWERLQQGQLYGCGCRVQDRYGRSHSEAMEDLDVESCTCLGEDYGSCTPA